tara:strand:- start:1999 stop:3684 length:1686 start_codon:yes stop_codon:yes gene_type:complete
MVKLLRIKGDSTKNDTEIRNIFTETIQVLPRSKLALRSVRVNLANTPDFEDFDLVEDSTIVVDIGNATGTATIVKGDYISANRILTECQIQCNAANYISTGNNVYGYVHWQRNGSKSRCDIYETHQEAAGFIDDGNWITLEGDRASAGITNTTIISDSTAIEFFQEILVSTIPLTENVMSAALGTAQADTGTARIGAVSGAGGKMYYGIGLDAQVGTSGIYNIVKDDSLTPVVPTDENKIDGITVDNAGTTYAAGDAGSLTGGTGSGATYQVTSVTGGQVTGVEIISSGDRLYVPTDVLTLGDSGDGLATVQIQTLLPAVALGDVMKVNKVGNKCFLTLKRAGSSVKVINETITLSQECLEDQKCYWEIQGTNKEIGKSVHLNNVEVMTISLDPDPTLLGAGAQTSGSVMFPSIKPLGYNRLGVFLGFGDADTQYKAVGNPAVINSPKRLGGNLNYPGVMLGIEGLDLDSYSGGIDVQPSGIAIIDVLYPEDPDELNIIQMRVNDSMKLNIKNEQTLGIRDLRLAFYRDGEDSTGKSNGRFEKLQFIGTPVVVLEIFDPDE